MTRQLLIPCMVAGSLLLAIDTFGPSSTPDADSFAPVNAAFGGSFTTGGTVARLTTELIGAIQAVGAVLYETDLVDGKPYGKEIADAFEGPKSVYEATPDFVYLGPTYPVSSVSTPPIRGIVYDFSPTTVQNPDRILKNIWVLNGIRFLVLREAQINETSLVYLQSLSKLEYLDVSKTDIGDAAIPVIEKLPHLKTLRVGGTKISDAAIDRLKRMRPRLVVER